MKIILRQDVENLGNIGEIVVVKPGYARNFLIPNQLAYVATEGAIRALETEKQQYLDSKNTNDAHIYIIFPAEDKTADKEKELNKFLDPKNPKDAEVIAKLKAQDLKEAADLSPEQFAQQFQTWSDRYLNTQTVTIKY